MSGDREADGLQASYRLDTDRHYPPQGPRSAVRSHRLRRPLHKKWASPVRQLDQDGADRQAVYARERAKLDAYDDELAAKGCKTVNIEAELARPAEGPKRY